MTLSPTSLTYMSHQSPRNRTKSQWIMWKAMEKKVLRNESVREADVGGFNISLLRVNLLCRGTSFLLRNKAIHEKKKFNEFSFLLVFLRFKEIVDTAWDEGITFHYWFFLMFCMFSYFLYFFATAKEKSQEIVFGQSFEKRMGFIWDDDCKLMNIVWMLTLSVSLWRFAVTEPTEQPDLFLIHCSMQIKNRINKSHFRGASSSIERRKKLSLLPFSSIE